VFAETLDNSLPFYNNFLDKSRFVEVKCVPYGVAASKRKTCLSDWVYII
jgi:hypothetical protein